MEYIITMDIKNESALAQRKKTGRKALGDKARRNGKPMSVYGTDEERQTIKENATKAGISVNEYMIRVATGYKIKSQLDYKLIEFLLKINADNGRLGGLLKLWLTDDAKSKDFNKAQIRGVLNLILKNQLILKSHVQKTLAAKENES